MNVKLSSRIANELFPNLLIFSFALASNQPGEPGLVSNRFLLHDMKVPTSWKKYKKVEAAIYKILLTQIKC